MLRLAHVPGRDALGGLLPDRRFAGEWRWHVLRVKSRQEKALSADLDRLRVPHFLPVRREVRYHARRKALVVVPVFPGYLFLWGSRDKAFEADRTHRVAQLISVYDQELLERELQSLHRALSSGTPLPHPALPKGTWVLVTSGPFKGLEGRVDRIRDPQRVVLQVSMLGSGVSLEIESSLLLRIDDD